MHTLVLEGECALRGGSRPLPLTQMPDPAPGQGELRVKVSACGERPRGAG